MRQCDVYVHDRFAGRLTETDSPRSYIFRYDREYVVSGGEQVCVAMPLRMEEYRSEILFPYFFNMLSEGDNRALQSSLWHTDPEDDFGILLATGQYDTPGAVTVRPVVNDSDQKMK